jgi:hypothetical protein
MKAESAMSGEGRMVRVETVAPVGLMWLAGPPFHENIENETLVTSPSPQVRRIAAQVGQVAAQLKRMAALLRRVAEQVRRVAEQAWRVAAQACQTVE